MHIITSKSGPLPTPLKTCAEFPPFLRSNPITLRPFSETPSKDFGPVPQTPNTKNPLPFFFLQRQFSPHFFFLFRCRARSFKSASVIFLGGVFFLNLSWRLSGPWKCGDPHKGRPPSSMRLSGILLVSPGHGSPQFASYLDDLPLSGWLCVRLFFVFPPPRGLGFPPPPMAARLCPAFFFRLFLYHFRSNVSLGAVSGPTFRVAGRLALTIIPPLAFCSLQDDRIAFPKRSLFVVGPLNVFHPLSANEGDPRLKHV